MSWSVRPPWRARRLGPSLVSACWDGCAATIVVTACLGRATLRQVNANRDSDLDITDTTQGDESALRAYWSVSAAARRLDAPLSPGVAFVVAAGAERALDEICRKLELDEVGADQLTAREEEATTYAAGYELAQWVGPCSDDIIGDLAILTGRMTTDAPVGDLDWEPESWDRQRVREAEARTSRLGRRWVTTAARHVASGRVGAYTDIGWSEQLASTAFQWMTIVAPEHRGRRLGMLIKAANLRALRREDPCVERVITWNADSNQQMIAINETLGFRPRLRFGQWQLKVSL